MSKKFIITILVLVVLVLGVIYWSSTGFENFTLSGTSSSRAIEKIKVQYPELNDYPSNNLPPRSIRSERADGGEYVAFIQEGSGRPIISAKCFFVDNQENIMSMRTYDPLIEDDFTAEFSAKTCSPGACAMENCHGLDIKCGSNPPDVCTEIYMLGDKCLQYAKCGVKNGQCQQIENSQFLRCKSCVQKCTDTYKDNNIKLFECENKCN